MTNKVIYINYYNIKKKIFQDFFQFIYIRKGVVFSMKHYCKRAWAEIHLDRLERNINTIKNGLSENTEIMAVVKADAYGHGEAEILHKLTSCGIKYFAVSNLDEAISVRKHCVDGEILILGYTPPECADELINYNIIQGIVSE